MQRPSRFRAPARRPALAATITVLCTLGCGGNSTAPQPDAALAWDAFEAGQMIEALQRFNDVLAVDPHSADALTGRGFTNLRLDQLEAAVQDFEAARGAEPAGCDAGAGLAVAFLDLGTGTASAGLERAVQEAQGALECAPEYLFAHDGRFDWHDLRLVQAQAQFALGHWLPAYEQARLLGAVELDPDAGDFPQALLHEIERLQGLWGASKGSGS